MTGIRRPPAPGVRGASVPPEPPRALDTGAVADTSTVVSTGGQPDGLEPTPLGRTALELDATATHATPGGVVHAFASHQATGRDAVHAELAAVRAKLALAMQALPNAGAGAAQRALEVSAERVLTALDAGRISVDEAARAAHMLSEMTGALLAIEQGRCTVSGSTAADLTDVESFDVRTDEGDVLRVSARLQGSTAGQARLKFYNVADDGQPVRAEQKIMVRFDLEGSELVDAPLRTSVDVQLGHEKGTPGIDRLDKKIHGVLLDASGQPVLNRPGNTVPDHHFGGVPDSINDRQGFRDFVESFLQELRRQAVGAP